MPYIIVSQPFTLRFGPDEPRRDFAAGKHEITDDELQNWYIKACIDDGSIVLSGGPKDTSEDVEKTETEPPEPLPEGDPKDEQKKQPASSAKGKKGKK